MIGMARRLALGVILAVLGTSVAAQDLRIVTVTRTPFSHMEGGADTGFSIELWAAVAERLGQSYSIDRVGSFGEMLNEVAEGRADVAAANISITAEREAMMDFSQPIFSSGLRVMVPAEQTDTSVFTIIWSRDLALVALAAFGLLNELALMRGLLLAAPTAAGVLLGTWLFSPRLQPYYRTACLSLLSGLAAVGIARIALR